MSGDKNKNPNELIYQKSPYLLQHAYNPVKWYPWGEEALDRAKKEDKPIFLSIGYSTCRWCHNMNRESFQDEEVAEILNSHFIPIKVDREERPDIDKVYITFSEAMTGSAGWPLNLLLTPEKEPFFAGTYFPKRSERGLTGLIDLLTKVKNLWQDKKQEIIKDSNQIVREVNSRYNILSEGNLDGDILKKTKDELESIFDENNGGFSRRPKFPLPQYVLFLLQYGQSVDDNKALYMAETTLKSMYKGGIFDHVGFGFYRYSVDEKWLVPHFEKMLYDNALLGIAYTKAYEITKKSLYRDVAEKIFKFVLKELTSDKGGFYSALDAESEGEEGKYYIFEYDEVISLLGEELGEFYCDNYDITDEGNFEGKNIPNLIDKDLDSISEENKNRLDSLRDMLLTYREKRTKPHRDEKILTSWNGLMIAALAYGGKVMDNNIFTNKAKEAADFIIANSVDEDGHLLSTHIGGESYNYGFLEDYAFFTFGLLSLYDVTKDEAYFKIGKNLAYDMIELFLDEKDGGMFYYSDISEELILRPKDIYDGAIPSGNSFAILVLSKLYRITKDENIYEKYQNLIHSFGENINKRPSSYVYSILALLNFNL
ncbi:thioredoxin domain-containing protein [Schnuerera sp. xch1]|uniref:thioredoxin domain-containing protein n=1 Tax=Schnuerera sp. xch1 TaxID=2874283 RepID=UPI001CBD3D34|nr:thioredoxin domain-containing protein [Schnuerera sp. xch1]MBZ2175576.1 thioredoxin domain-containing protein [Schnuerera sp. xch1]